MNKRQLTPELPTYESAQRFLQVIDGARESNYRSMHKECWAQRGSLHNMVDWKEPEVWIPQRLSGDNRELALRFWRESDRHVNPRHTFGHMYLCTIHELLTNQEDILRVSENGSQFLECNEEYIGTLDDYEGMLQLLTDIASSAGQRIDFIDAFRDFCLANSTLQADSTITSAMSYRLKNLVQRSLVEKRGRVYQITDAGVNFLRLVKGDKVSDQPTIEQLVKLKNTAAHEQLAKFLQTMDPYKFEHLIKYLLQEMGYDNAEVTTASNDKGVDVVADIELGISRVREVIQVKRQQGSIGRPVLDGLRGSLHRFDAVRATIITTGRFSKGANKAAFEKGAAPITLIDGEQLISLLIEYSIGIRRREIRILEFDSERLRQFESAPELIETD